MGAAVAAVLILNGFNPWLTLVVAFFAGACAGLVTGLIHVKGKVRDLLSGIITMTALYSINIHIATGKSNLAIFTGETIFNSGIAAMLPQFLQPYRVLIISFVLIVICKLIMDWYLNTKSGFLLFAAGDNQQVVTALAEDHGKVKIMGLVLANGLVALSGAVLCQHQRFFDVSMGPGSVVLGLAAVIMGMKLLGNLNFVKGTTAAICGAILYKACYAGAISLGMEAVDMKLITAMLFLVVLMFNTDKKDRKKGGKPRA
jgi:putative ABC transport system permease protein